MSYSVGVQNIFELLEDENDDQPDVRTPQTKLEETKKAPVNRQPPVGDNKPKAAQRDANQKKPVADAKLEGFTDVTSQKSRSPSTRNAGDRNRDNRGPRRDGDRPPRRDGDRPPRRDGDRPPREGGDRPREPREPREGGEQRTREPRAPREGREPREHRAPREDRPPREGREDRGPIVGQPKQDRDKEKYHREVQNAPYDGKTNKRTYDRHSGTGRNRTENKKGGAGGANWGSETDPKEELAAEGQVKEDAAADAKDESAVETPAEGETTAEPAVPEKKELSLAEYRKQREQSLAALPSLPTPRAAGEGVNDKEKDKWATEALKKENENKKAAARKEGEAAAEKKEKENKKATASLDQFFHIKPRERPKYDDREDRGDRADRPPRRDGDRPRREGDNRGPRNNKGEKGAKGEGAKKAPQGGAETQPIVKTDVDFPTLNTKA